MRREFLLLLFFLILLLVETSEGHNHHLSSHVMPRVLQTANSIDEEAVNCNSQDATSGCFLTKDHLTDNVASFLALLHSAYRHDLCETDFLTSLDRLRLSAAHGTLKSPQMITLQLCAAHTRDMRQFVLSHRATTDNTAAESSSNLGETSSCNVAHAFVLNVVDDFATTVTRLPTQEELLDAAAVAIVDWRLEMAALASGFVGVITDAEDIIELAPLGTMSPKSIDCSTQLASVVEAVSADVISQVRRLCWRLAELRVFIDALEELQQTLLGFSSASSNYEPTQTLEAWLNYCHESHTRTGWKFMRGAQV